MRIMPITLSVLMIFTPAYSAYASMLPAKGQIVQIGKKGGALIKTGAGFAKKIATPVGATVTAGTFAWDWCKKNQKKCKDKIGDAYEIICDVTSCDVERKDDSDGQCVARFGDDKQTLSAFLSSQKRTVTQGGITTQYIPVDDAYEVLEKRAKSAISSSNKGYKDWVYYHGQFGMNTKSTYAETGAHLYSGGAQYYVQVWVKCGGLDDDDRKISDKELTDLAKKIAEKMDDDDIKNYYNTKYDDIIINNNHYYGDEINKETNIDKYCESNACNEISKEIEQDIKDKKYDIDDVNERNCTIEQSTGKYIACNMTIKNEEEDNSNKEGDTTNKDTVTKKEDEEDPYKCGTTDLTKKICSFLDWSKSGDYDDEDDKVKIKEDKEDKPNTKVEFTGTCPAPYEIDISLDAGFMGTIDYDFVLLDTPKLCAFLDDWVEPIVYVLGPLHAIYILGGNRENV
ncbi:Uncharacterised protein [Moraxella caprae]|uniref:Neisseria meningitidis TspB protein n=1 Tax=Moraxella caprae TaxID=90240 RepID=A0A378QZA5_9GAMM|nr:hypothetical protein [Moraxella caprae]STZ08294.1 Uncharacterised protein [Moraxella caprae]